MPITDFASLCQRIPDGALLAVPKTTAGVAMAVTREIIRRGVRGLHLVGVPTSGLQADLLIGAGCVKTIETSAVSLGEFGTGPRFAAAVKAGQVDVLDATCPAIYAALQAGLKGLPFTPLRGLIGSDVLARRRDWKVIDNPFAADDPVALLPALRPHFALFHARMADRHGNVYIGRERELMIMAQAAHETLVTVEEIVDADFMADEPMATGSLAAIYVSDIALAPRGAWPLPLPERHGLDAAVLADYARRARSAEGFDAFVADWLNGDLERAAASAASEVTA